MRDAATSQVAPSAPKRGAGETRAIVLGLARTGKSVRQIAGIAGISTQAVHDHLRRLRRDGELPEQDDAA